MASADLYDGSRWNIYAISTGAFLGAVRLSPDGFSGYDALPAFVPDAPSIPPLKGVTLDTALTYLQARRQRANTPADKSASNQGSLF